MAKPRKSRPSSEETPPEVDPTAEATTEIEETSAEPPAAAPEPEDDGPEAAETGESPEGAAIVEANPAGDDAETPEADLENAGEMEDESAVLIDQELTTLLGTPLGLRGAVEALLFISPEPLTPRRIGNVLDVRDSRLVIATLKQLQAEYDNERRGLQVLETAEGFQMATRELFGDLILRLKGRKRRPTLSPAALETLAIVAYRQPMIRAEVEAIRGVESSGSIRNLIDMGLVEMVGRKDVLGRPPMYGTTAQFLQMFGLKDLTELPSIAELKRQYLETEKAAEDVEREQAAARREQEGRERLEISERLRAEALAAKQAHEAGDADEQSEAPKTGDDADAEASQESENAAAEAAAESETLAQAEPETEAPEPEDLSDEPESPEAEEADEADGDGDDEQEDGDEDNNGDGVGEDPEDDDDDDDEGDWDDDDEEDDDEDEDEDDR